MRARMLASLFLIITIAVLTACTSTSSPTPAQDSTASPSAPMSYNPTLPDFTSVLELATPSVVAIDTQVETFDIFNRPVQREGAGSGWIFHSDGLVITNNHVIAQASKITITFHDGNTLPATLLGGDALTDLAVLEVDASNLTPIKVTDSKPERGEWVLSIGNSLGLGVTAKEGIVSRLGVSLPVSAGQTVENLVETSAAINPGNSGGPLVNMEGEVIGITSIKIGAAGVEGLGYAISAQQAVPIVQELIINGYIARPWLGVSVRTVTPFVAEVFGLSVDEGTLVTEVAANSPAQQAGIQQGDVITRLDDTEVKIAQDLRDIIHDAKVGDRVQISYWRGNNQNTAQVTLVESPPPD